MAKTLISEQRDRPRNSEYRFSRDAFLIVQEFDGFTLSLIAEDKRRWNYLVLTSIWIHDTALTLMRGCPEVFLPQGLRVYFEDLWCLLNGRRDVMFVLCIFIYFIIILNHRVWNCQKYSFLFRHYIDLKNC